MAKWSEDRKKAHSDAMRRAWITRRRRKQGIDNVTAEYEIRTDKQRLAEGRTVKKKTRAMNRIEAASAFVRSCGSLGTAKHVLRAFEGLGGTSGARKVIALVDTLNSKDGKTDGNHSG